MSAAVQRQIKSHYGVVERLPEDTVVTFYHANWEDYEKLLAQVGEASGLRVSYDEGVIEVMSLSTEHENYAEFISGLLRVLSLRLRINIRFFGSATMKKRRLKKGLEPDGCFYVQSVAGIGTRQHLDFETDPPPDVAVEIDLHHDSRGKYPIYAGLGVSEIWRYDGYRLTVLVLSAGNYVEVEASPALPMLTGKVLTEFLSRQQSDGEFETLIAFEEWLQKQSG